MNLWFSPHGLPAAPSGGDANCGKGASSRGCAMPETGFSIWLGAICSTQAEAAKSLGITDRSVRRYKEGERKVPTTVAKMMFRMAMECYRPEMPIHLFHFGEWPDCPTDARALLNNLQKMQCPLDELSPDSDMQADIWTAGPTISDTRTGGPDKSDKRTSGPDKSDMRTAGPLRSWFSWLRPSVGWTG